MSVLLHKILPLKVQYFIKKTLSQKIEMKKIFSHVFPSMSVLLHKILPLKVQYFIKKTLSQKIEMKKYFHMYSRV